MVAELNVGMDYLERKKDALIRFVSDESGAVSVDWVVLTAGVVGLVLGIFTILGNDTADYSDRIGVYMTSQGIKTY